jgi:carotenoid cleavage dioxygenase-like enzyme
MKALTGRLASLLPAWPQDVLANAFDSRLKNPVNTSPLFWAGKLLSCFEAGLPYQVQTA